MHLVQLQVYGRTRSVGRVLCRVAVLALLASVVLPRCSAAKLRQHYSAGVYMTENGQLIRDLAGRTPGTYWIDGYQMTVSKDTRICWHDAPLQFGAVLNWAAQPVPMLRMTFPCESTPPVDLESTAWLQYLGSQRYHRGIFEPQMNVVTTRIDVCNREHDREGESSASTAIMPAWKTLCSSTSLHELRYPNEYPIEVVCDSKVNNYVRSVFAALLKPDEATLGAPTARLKVPRFYVVKPFQVRQNYDFQAIDGLRESCLENAIGCAYGNSYAHSTVRDIVYVRDGSVLIPDTTLTHVKNEAQVAALFQSGEPPALPGRQ